MKQTALKNCRNDEERAVVSGLYELEFIDGDVDMRINTYWTPLGK